MSHFQALILRINKRVCLSELILSSDKALLPHNIVRQADRNIRVVLVVDDFRMTYLVLQVIDPNPWASELTLLM